MMSCKDAGEALSKSLDGKLGWGRRLALGLHLFVCGMCRRLRRQLRLLDRAGRQADAREDAQTDGGAALSEAARERIKHALRREAGGSPQREEPA
jgi:hypothetical protein